MSVRYNIKNDNTKTFIYFNPSKTNNLEDIKILLEAAGDIDVYPNDEEDRNNSYKNVTDYIYRIITKSEFLCKGLNPEYILDAFDNVDAVIIIGSKMNILPNGNIFGFALMNFDQEKNSIYIDVICSHIGIKGAGDILMKEIEAITRKLLMTDIYLTSVKSAISFYEKYHFTKFDESCQHMCVMKKSLKTKSPKPKKSSKTKSSKPKKSSKTKSSKPKKSSKNEYFK
jgi:N-acetylglutamate synthase-like GNAT family acetyltransferase